MFWLYSILFIYGLLCQETMCLRMWRVVVPAYKLRGETALLECQYELENNKHIHDLDDINYNMMNMNNNENNDKESLYSVKWYKDNEEFYRYVPKANPPQHSYKIEGIRVDHQLSDSTKVTLRSVNLKTSGLYRCEVSAEAPSFNSVQGDGRMEVVYLPKDGPHITGEEEQYQIGDLINLNCTSGRSYPASMLQWYINDEAVLNSQSLVTYPDMHHIHGLITTTLGLYLVVDGKHFKDSEMRVRCVASVSPVLWQGGKESIVQRKLPLIDNREALLLVRSSAHHFQTEFKLVILVTMLLLYVL